MITSSCAPRPRGARALLSLTGLVLLALLPGTRPAAAGDAVSTPRSQSIQAGILPKNPNAAKDAAYSCPEPASAVALLAQARVLALQTYDKNKLACAADLYYRLASSSSSSPAIRIAAVQAQVAYLHEVDVEHDLDFAGQQTAEWNIRLAHGAEQARLLCAGRQTASLALATVCAEAHLREHRYDDPKDYVAAVRRVIPALTDVSQRAPQTLDGLDLVYLGKLYLDLPTIFGGDSAKAVSLLERARRYAPRDPQRLSDLALAYEAVGRSREAKGVLPGLAALDPADGSLQSLADAWMVGEGLASRLGVRAMETRFELERHRLFVAHPELQTRLRSAIAGHGGVNPLTGKPQY
jgi:tetratricopeptide (TPR) repeat protein